MQQLVPLLLLIGAGYAWRSVQPGGVDAAGMRRHLNVLLIYLLVPAMVFRVMATAPLDRHLLLVVVSGWITIAASGLLAYGLHRLLQRFSDLPAATRGALVLAAIFGNGLGAALPVLHELYHGEHDQLVLGFELLATIPLAWTIGVYVATRFGDRGAIHPLRQILSLPPIWALVLALAFNVSGLSIPPLLRPAFELLGNAVLALMLLTLGMALDFRRTPALAWLGLPAIIRVAGGLVCGIVLGAMFDFPPADRPALIWICAAPSFLMGLVFCDRFGLDTSTFALTMSVSVVIYLGLVPVALRALPG